MATTVHTASSASLGLSGAPSLPPPMHCPGFMVVHVGGELSPGPVTAPDGSRSQADVKAQKSKGGRATVQLDFAVLCEPRVQKGYQRVR